jgi:3-oxoacyl-[acyl-carrier-protein] synthase-3
LPIPRERWFSNLTRKGNTGSASPFIMLDELFRSGRIQPGHKLLMFVPESGRFSAGFIHMEAV